jgi:hypothetical protein
MSIVNSEGEFTINITANQYINTDSTYFLDSIYIYSKFYDKKRIGKLKYFCAAKVNKSVKLVYLKTDSLEGYRNNIDTEIITYLNSRSMNQLFLNFILEPTDYFDVSNKNYNKEFLANYKNSFLDIFNAYKLKKWNNDSIIVGLKKYDVFFICNYSISNTNNNDLTSTLGGFHLINEQGGALTLSSISVGEATAHELGHWLGMPEAFEPNNAKLAAHRQIGSENGQGKTQNNFMDYFSSNGQRKSWLWYQIMKTKEKR